MMVYKGEYLSKIGFPLGGIGTGCISLGGWGQLKDWEIMNRPAKGFTPEYCFFTLRLDIGKKPIVKVLQGPAVGINYNAGGHSADRMSGEGLPHFRSNIFTSQFPFAKLSFVDPEIPKKLHIGLSAFNPFIPKNDKDSSIPVVILEYIVLNETKQKISGSIFGNLQNIIGHPERKGRNNETRISKSIKGLWMSNGNYTKDSPHYGTMALTTTREEAQVWQCWGGNWQSGLVKFWDVVTNSTENNFPNQKSIGDLDVGTLATYFTLNPGECVFIPFYITWHFPNYEHWNKQECCSDSNCDSKSITPVWKNYYATQWKDAWEVAEYVASNHGRLQAESVAFAQSLLSSSIPKPVLDAVISQLSILKTPTCLRLEDGTFYGFEGCSDTLGCCEGSCSHVWNYSQSLAYLFPNLQKSMIDTHFKHNMRKDGMMQFRLPLPLGTHPKFDFHPAADGQMGLILQVYRHWLLTGDEKWLKEIWSFVKKSLEFALKYWDKNNDGVMEGMQHNTYDIEFYGPNPMTGTLYLGALRAGEEIAKYLGENEKANEYRKLFAKGSKWMDKHLFNGEYYEQRVNPDAHLIWPEIYQSLTEKHGEDDKFKDWPKWQFGKGCLSDQLIGQWYSEMLGLGNLLDSKNIKKTLKSIFKYNWKKDLRQHPNFLRIYAYGHESGLLTCTWPKDERPGNAFYFADEIWSGIEYQVASHLIYEGLVEEGLKIVKGLRDRYDGYKRNPWDEIECGHHYARSLASYGLLTALSGFNYSAFEKRISFNPRIHPNNFSTFFSVGSGWGVYSQKIQKKKMSIYINIEYGALALSEIHINPGSLYPKNVSGNLGFESVSAWIHKKTLGYVIKFERPIKIGTLKLSIY